MKLALLLVAAILVLQGMPSEAREPSSSAPVRESARKSACFESFDRRAKAGARLNVVFFGASLTWGSNASDPQLTSYRALVGQRLEKRYPDAHFKFWDAAIGGTTSQLGVFRLERDVLRRHPDLVFIDFTVNDGIGSPKKETLASYEALVRRIILEAHCPVIDMILLFRWHMKPWKCKLKDFVRRDAHLRINKAYGVPTGDAVKLCLDRVKAKAGKITRQNPKYWAALQKLWPYDGSHPGDAGYRLFADAAWQAFLDGVKRKKVCRVPDKTLYGDTYLTSRRVRISSLGVLPEGWRIGTPCPDARWYDGLMTRWLDDEVIASNRKTVFRGGKPKIVPQAVKSLKFKINGSMILLFGELSLKSGKYRVLLDGKPIEYKPWNREKKVALFDATAKDFGGNSRLVEVLAENLDVKGDHILEIAPVFDENQEQELRLESICVAGGQAKVARLAP